MDIHFALGISYLFIYIYIYILSIWDKPRAKNIWSFY